MSSSTAQVVCIKWGTKYGPEYVNRLFGMVARNLSRPFRFVCFTDDASGLRDEVEVLPIPELRCEGWPTSPGFRKVALFSPRLTELSGDALFLDLDVVVTGPLDDLFEYPGEIVTARDYKILRFKGDYFVGNTSVLRFPIGKYPEYFERFEREFQTIRQEVRNEQEYLSHYFHPRGLLKHWPKGWCPSFKADCVAPWPLSYFTTPKRPADARVIVFHGRPNPDEAIEGRGGKWYRGIRPTPWIEEYWRE